jgi:Ser/Thr protein kinase RdoA (MazF antagonist)
VYDVATFLLTLHGANSNAFKQAFLDGYNEVRQLDAFEQELIPLFKIMRAVVTIGIPVMNVHHWGRANIEPWFKYSFENIEQSMKQLEGATD